MPSQNVFYFWGNLQIMKRSLIIFALAVLMSACDKEKTAYVDTTRLIQEFSEMKEVEAAFTQKGDALKQEMDSIARNFQQEVLEYQENRMTMSQAERQAAEQELMAKQQALQQEQQMKSSLLRKESDAAIDSLVTTVKDFVADYGEENGYTYIFGSNESANIMYAKEGLDITDEVLAQLNAGSSTESEGTE